MNAKNELLADILEARAKVKDIEDTLAKVKQVKDDAEVKLLQIMELADEKSFKTAAGVLVTRREVLRASIIKEKYDEALTWIDEECGRSDIIKRTVHHKTFATFIKQRMEKRDPVPNELVTCYFQPNLSIRK
jgi:hypothetical protein